MKKSFHITSISQSAPQLETKLKLQLKSQLKLQFKSLVAATFLTTSIFSSFSGAQTKKAPQNSREKQIVALFDEIKKKSKGALDLNMYQTPLGRVIVSPKDPATGKNYLLAPPPGTQLTVAFRNTTAEQLAGLGFYVGNRYGSNYFDLRNQYIESPNGAQTLNQQLILAPKSYNYSGASVSLNDADRARLEAAAKTFQLRHNDLKQNSAALTTAKLMAQHQMLELYYILNSPETSLAKSFKQRGVSDDKNEIQYYRLLADYLAGYVQSNSDYLLQYEFQSRSELVPGKKTISLSAMRLHVAQIYDRMAQAADTQGFSKSESDKFRALRNTIHNSMRSSVVDELQKFLSQNQGRLRTIVFDAATNSGELSTEISTLIANIQSYYKIDTEMFVVLQKSIEADLPEINNVVAQFKAIADGKNKMDLNFIMQLAQYASKARVSFEKSRNIDLIHFIIRAAQVVVQEMGKNFSNTADVQKAKFSALTNINYATGIFSSQQLNTINQYTANNFTQSVSITRQYLGEAISVYNSIFQPALEDWKLVSTSIFKFVEDGLRSTTLIQLDALVSEIGASNGGLPSTPATPGATQNTADASGKGKFVVETQGLGYGYLRFIPKDKTESLTQQMTYKDIPIFESMPLDLGVVAGTITEQPQTPLSHVNMKSKDRKTPNMYLEKASKLPQVAKLLNKLVKMELTANNYTLTEVSLQEAEAYWSGKKNSVKKIDLRADVTEKRIRPTSAMGFNDVISVGAKAANYAEGTKLLPGVFRDGFAIPFSYYEEYINTNAIADNSKVTIAQFINQLVKDKSVQSDRNVLIEKLNMLQARMRSTGTKINPQLVAEVKKLVSERYPGQKIRFRSSTNSEDRPEFTGAGLYTSEGYNPKHDDSNYVDKKTGKAPAVRKTIENALRTVWSSVWNLRTWDEREHYGIAHEQVKMAIALTPGYKELANGVGVSKNTVMPELGPGVYLNIQDGEDAVTNPDPTITPDQVLVLFKPDGNKKYTLKYLKYSSKTKDKPVLEYAEVEKITDHLVTLHNHFKKLYNPNATGPVKFALDVEFKVDDVDNNGKEDGVRRVFYKQARPFGG